MKNTIKMLGIIALAAVIGFSMVACGGGDDDDDTKQQPSNSGLAAPTGLSATNSGTTIYVTWNPVSGASGYNIYFSLSSNFPPSSTDYDFVQGTSYTEYNVPSGYTFYIKVAAYNSNGEGAFSNIVSVTVTGGTTPQPNTSLNGTWQQGNAQQVTVSGNAGVITAFGNPDALMQSAINKGYIQIGTQYWKSLTSTGNLTWSGQWLAITYNSSNVATGTQWSSNTWRMSADGRTLTVGSYTWTRQ